MDSHTVSSSKVVSILVKPSSVAMEWYQMDAGKCLEFSKKMAVLRKMVRLGLISENEYIRAKNRIMSSYHILESEYFKTGTGKRVA